MKWLHWGCLDYQQSLENQKQLLSEVQQGAEDHVVFCTHPPVVTLGRAAQDYEYKDWQGELVSIHRGGRSTYHGPNQLVIYPIVDLRRPGRSGLRKEKDIGSYLRLFERSLVETVAIYGVEATGRSSQQRDEQTPAEEATGVWMKDRKLASLGIAVKKWCTFHGAAINLHRDDQAFAGLYPCGFQAQTMVSLEELTGYEIDREEFISHLKEKMLEFFL